MAHHFPHGTNDRLKTGPALPAPTWSAPELVAASCAAEVHSFRVGADAG